MNDKKANRVLNGFMILPILLAVSGVILNIKLIDCIYLVLVTLILLKYFLTAED